MIELIAYGDFNCPFSALASRRAAELEQRGIAAIDWRAVEHAPDIPFAGQDITGDVAKMLRDELRQVRGLLEEGEPDVLRLPARQVNTALAVNRYAGTPADQRPALRQDLFAAHWERGERIDDAELLDRLGAGPIDLETAREWRRQWRAGPRPIVPTLVLPDGRFSRGLGALNRLAILLEGGSADAGDGADRGRAQPAESRR